MSGKWYINILFEYVFLNNVKADRKTDGKAKNNEASR